MSRAKHGRRASLDNRHRRRDHQTRVKDRQERVMLKTVRLLLTSHLHLVVGLVYCEDCERSLAFKFLLVLDLTSSLTRRTKLTNLVARHHPGTGGTRRTETGNGIDDG